MTRRRPRWLAHEVVQTSSMDCGPAALKCLLEGHGIAASYGRLREACQTSVDGTSIDTLEVVAQQLGLVAEQVLVPADHLALPGAAGPAIVVVRHPDAGTHFIVVWRRAGRWLQVMDPATGRRWLSARELQAALYRHEMAVDANDWRDWAASAENQAALTARMAALGVPAAQQGNLWHAALADPTWFALGALDAAVRLARALCDAGGLRRGTEAAALLQALFDRTRASPHDIYTQVPATWWSVAPDAGNTDATRERLRVRGAVVLRVHGTGPAPAGLPPPGPELAAALAERAEPLAATLWWLLRKDGRRAPLLLAAAVALATAALMLQALMLRGLIELSVPLATTAQRLSALGALLAFLALLVLVEWPIVRESLRLGRHLELRLRAALLHKLPRLHDRYFQSRPIADMADRSHGIQAARAVPLLLLQAWQSLLEGALTVAALLWLAPASAAWALGLAAVALAVPLAAQPLLNERDLRVRTHGAALAGFTLDALLGLVPVRAHRAERSLRREHEGLLADWARALRGWIGASLAADGVQGLFCIALAGGLVISHFRAQGGVAGSDLLLVFWTLKLPGLGQRIAHLAQQLPAQRNALRRLLEPLSAPDDALPAAVTHRGPVQLQLRGAHVQAGGHDILQAVDLQVAAGEHVAIVGVSGAGKSSLLGVLLGWHHLAGGELRLDGRPLQPGALQALRRDTAWVDPAVQLWNRSLLHNLQYASSDDGLARVGAAVQGAQLRGVTARLPQGLQTLLGEGGTRLSGGEGQRVRLGRALLQPAPRLVLLDEPFRGLDRDQRAALLAEARQWWQGTTLLCVTHDVGETRGFDRVLVVEDGRIVEDGAPQVLAAGASRYRQLLDAEHSLRRTLWDQGWRQLQLRDGRLHEGP